MKINEIANEKVEQVRDTLDFEVTSYMSSESLLQFHFVYAVSTNNYFISTMNRPNLTMNQKGKRNEQPMLKLRTYTRICNCTTNKFDQMHTIPLLS